MVVVVVVVVTEVVVCNVGVVSRGCDGGLGVTGMMATVRGGD